MSKANAAALSPQRPERRPDIDWLRALAVLLLAPCHPALVFCRDGMFPSRSGLAGLNYARLLIMLLRTAGRS
jgi:peptidoglycan/LPS O-acetylase OafA/YrhL